ncbi:hypothetical protein HK104_001112, partial [Borealophlyctis nickersoniae]
MITATRTSTTEAPSNDDSQPRQQRTVRVSSPATRGETGAGTTGMTAAQLARRASVLARRQSLGVGGGVGGGGGGGMNMFQNFTGPVTFEDVELAFELLSKDGKRISRDDVKNFVD